MSSTERKAFLQRRSSSSAERAAYRAKMKAEHKAYWSSPKGRVAQEKITAAHAAWVAAGMPPAKTDN